MTSEERNLWNRISSFQLDQPEIEFSFSDRLARENGWSKAYTERVIDEYKKFIYLCCVSEKGVTPSDPVDQAWHLHLTYTKSYWNGFCRDTIGKEIHHNPTKGGESEAKKFNGYYTYLKEIYKEHFNADPPEDIWQTNEVRFSDIDFQRVNLKKYWLIKKPGLTSITLFLIIVAGLISIQAKEFPTSVILFSVFIIGIVLYAVKNKGKGDSNNPAGGCGAGGCSTSHGHHSGDSGCSSGCSSSGCGGGD